jgi:hypothetical protein
LRGALPRGAELRQAETAAASDLEGNIDALFAIHDGTWCLRFGSHSWPIITGERRLSELMSEKCGSDNRKFG